MDTLTNQEFLYRETPVAYDGTGTITSIKGNTVSFNQLVPNGNFASTSGWSSSNATVSTSDNVITLKATAQNGQFYRYLNDLTLQHKYLKVVTVKGTSNATIRFTNIEINLIDITTSWQTFAFIVTHTTSGANYVGIQDIRGSGWDNIYVKNMMCFDLTLMGIDNLTTVAEVESWLSSHVGDLPYYDYTQGTLIPFMGTGLKTTGKNLFNKNDLVDGILRQTDGTVEIIGTWYTSDYIRIFPSTNYYINDFGTAGNRGIAFYDGNKTFISSLGLTQTKNSTFVTPTNAVYMRISCYPDVLNTAQLERGQQGTAYEPYTSNTLSLPTLTYFPTGMKSVGSVYDELTPSKAITRIGSYTFTGNETWNKQSDSDKAYYSLAYLVRDVAKLPVDNSHAVYIVSILGLSNNSYYGIAYGNAKGICIAADGRIGIGTDIYNNVSMLTGTSIYFELATSTETDISLDLTYPVWNGGTEQILPINDSTPDTAPILCDIDYRGLIPVNATVDPDGSGTVDGTGNYRYHSIATLEATPSDEIYRFLRWEDENGDTLSTNAIYSFEVGE